MRFQPHFPIPINLPFWKFTPIVYVCVCVSGVGKEDSEVGVLKTVSSYTESIFWKERPFLQFHYTFSEWPNPISCGCNISRPENFNLAHVWCICVFYISILCDTEGNSVKKCYSIKRCMMCVYVWVGSLCFILGEVNVKQSQRQCQQKSNLYRHNI